jgi:hypothetical protein
MVVRTHLATKHTAQAQTSHQSFDGAAGHRNAFAIHLRPDLVSAIDLHVGVPDPLDVWDECVIVLGSGTPQGRIAHLGCVAPVTRRGNLQDLADRLDPVRIPVAVDVCL